MTTNIVTVTSPSTPIAAITTPTTVETLTLDLGLDEPMGDNEHSVCHE